MFKSDLLKCITFNVLKILHKVLNYILLTTLLNFESLMNARKSFIGFLKIKRALLNDKNFIQYFFSLKITICQWAQQIPKF